MHISTLSRMAGSAVLALCLTGCIDINMDVNILGENSARVTTKVKMDRSIYEMAKQSDNKDGMCKDDSSVEIVQNQATCTDVLEGDFATVLEEAEKADGPQPKIELVSPGMVRVTFPTGSLLGEMGGQDMSTPEAKEIAKRMGERSIKRGAICVKCHYTEQEVGGSTKATSGVSCESCHGPARDWIALHNDYGGPGVTKASESPQHAELRRARSVAAGMRNPHNLYLVARSCFNCHTAPNESLVERGGHPTGSPDFELVAWSQGRVRHNFLRTGGAGNAADDRSRLRVMYVVGQLADLEYSLRALAVATLERFARRMLVRHYASPRVWRSLASKGLRRLRPGA